MNDFVKGFIGVIAPSGGFAVSLAQQIEPWLRIASLIVGIGVGIVTIISIRKKK